jgi:subtilase family serine protease
MSRNFQFRFLSLFFLGACIVAAGFLQTLSAQQVRLTPARVLITKPIDESQLYTLAGNTRGEANAANDQGKVPDTFALEHLLLELQRSPEREQALESFIEQQHDSKSPNFHQWLTAVEIGERYGPSQKDIDTLTGWLRDEGFTINTVHPSGMAIDFSGTAGQVLAAFHTEIHSLSVNGQTHIANMSDPKIPLALAPVITGIQSLHNFWPHSMVKPRVQLTGTVDTFQLQLVTPADLATIYDFGPAFSAGITGKGQTIAVLEDSNVFRTSDWTTFRNTFGLSSYASGNLVTVHPGCSNPGAQTGAGGDDSEATLDVEWSSAAAPNATIMLASCASTQTTFGVSLALQNLLSTTPLPQVISISYGFCEAGNGTAVNASFNTLYQQAVSQGVSVFVSSGDELAASCDVGGTAATHGIAVNGFGSTPYNVSVGGTDFGDTAQKNTAMYWSQTNSATYGSALSYIPEIPWNDSCMSSVVVGFFNYAVGYGASGLCGSVMAEEGMFLGVAGGSGGPSGCATGVPAENLVVGGSCQGYAKPSWQAGVPGIPNDHVRDMPDVSLFAANGVWGHYYVICFTDASNTGAPCTGNPINWAGAGGTSFSSPIMAGIQALVNQQLGGGAQGLPTPVYYKLAASSVASLVFHPTTTGDIAVNCAGDNNCFGQEFVGRGRGAFPTGNVNANGGLSTSNTAYAPAYSAGTSYNLATGLGSVDAYNLIMNWSKGQ